MSRLEEEKAETLREYNRLPKQEEVELHIKNLTRETEELRDEISKVGYHGLWRLVYHVLWRTGVPWVVEDWCCEMLLPCSEQVMANVIGKN